MKRCIEPAQLIVVAVGDKAKVVPQLEAIGRKAEVLNVEGKAEGKPQP